MLIEADGKAYYLWLVKYVVKCLCSHNVNTTKSHISHVDNIISSDRKNISSSADDDMK